MHDDDELFIWIEDNRKPPGGWGWVVFLVFALSFAMLMYYLGI